MDSRERAAAEEVPIINHRRSRLSWLRSRLDPQLRSLLPADLFTHWTLHNKHLGETFDNFSLQHSIVPGNTKKFHSCARPALAKIWLVFRKDQGASRVSDWKMVWHWSPVNWSDTKQFFFFESFITSTSRRQRLGEKWNHLSLSPRQAKSERGKKSLDWRLELMREIISLVRGKVRSSSLLNTSPRGSISRASFCVRNF